MSIATLKKKSNTLHGNYHSSARGGFSLNGSHRNIPYVGQSTQSRHFPRTPMNGADKCGNGGCCGTYNDAPLVVPIETKSTEDISVVKSSVLDYKGMSTMKYRWVRRPYPYAIKKPNNKVTSWPYKTFFNVCLGY